VIAISENTRRDVIQHLGVPADRVQTVYCGVDPTLRPAAASEVQAFRQQKGLPDRFILFVGTIQPRKNLARLVEAFGELTGGRGQLDDVHLVVAGSRGWLFEEVFARVEKLGLQERVHFVGYIPAAEKSLWYNASSCFCFPSLYEGFGLPVLEAMACGVPVVASDSSSLPEVVGDAGLTVPPTDTGALSEALHAVLADPTLHQELSAKGLARAHSFSWTKAARETAAVYRHAWGRA
jgi:glycosyltransferase involved in cell wall biosynthesis